MMKKSLAIIGLGAALAVPTAAMAATTAADDVDDTAVTCPYDGERLGLENMARQQGRLRTQALENNNGTAICDGSGGSGNGNGVQDGTGPIELGPQDGTGFRHGR